MVGVWRFQLRSSEQPAVIDVARQPAMRHTAQIIHSPGIRTVIKTGTTGITSEWETTLRWRTVPRCFFLRDRGANERAAGCADGRADGRALRMAGRRPADDCSSRRAPTRALPGVSVTRVQGQRA